MPEEQRGRLLLTASLSKAGELVTSDGDGAANHSGGRDLYPSRSDGRGHGPG